MTELFKHWVDCCVTVTNSSPCSHCIRISSHAQNLSLSSAGHELACHRASEWWCLTVSMHSQSGHFYPFLIPIQECWMLCHRAKRLKHPLFVKKINLSPESSLKMPVWEQDVHKHSSHLCPCSFCANTHSHFPSPAFPVARGLCKHFAFWHAIPIFSMLFSLFNWV